MPRDLGPLLQALAIQVDDALKLVQAAELVRSAVPVGSHARRGFSFHQIEAMYELAYLRVFAAWEAFLEESFYRMMCGYMSSGVTHSLRAPPRPRRVEDARLIVLDGQDFKPWHDPTIIVNRTAKFFVSVPGSDVPHSSVVASAHALIKDLSHIRHHIAHITADTCAKYQAATMRLCGARFGRKAGRFLRSESADPVTGLRVRWLERISSDLTALASQFL